MNSVSAMSLFEDLAAFADDTGFSGVVRVDRPGEEPLTLAHGLAHRGWGIPNEIDTRIAIASGSKGFTALAVVSLIVDGDLELSTPVRSILGDDLPLVADEVTVEHLLAHRSGIGDYLDESKYELTDYILPVPVQDLADLEQYVPILDGHSQSFPPDERFEYNNGGFMVLALIAERASGTPYHDLVRDRVTGPAGMVDTEFLRSDELPGRTALGYLDDGPRSNVFHLPIRGTGDGGIFTTAADVGAFWKSLFAGRIVPEDWVAEMTRPRSVSPDDGRRYGLGFWLHETSDAVMLVGSDTGSSFWSVHDPTRGLGHTTLSNQTDGAWVVSTWLDERLGF
jgi:CubicO group peptidase (beta-lactamase class C family)